MDQGGSQGMFIDDTQLEEDIHGGKGMNDIGFAGRSKLGSMGVFRQLIGKRNDSGIFLVGRFFPVVQKKIHVPVDLGHDGFLLLAVYDFRHRTRIPQASSFPHKGESDRAGLGPP